MLKRALLTWGMIHPGCVLLVLALLLVACQMTPRQKFYMAEVSFSGAQSAAIAYLKTPYGQRASDSVLTGIAEASEEGTQTLMRLRPLVPAPGEKIPERSQKYLDAGFDTLDSIIERLNRTVFARDSYEE